MVVPNVAQAAAVRAASGAPYECGRVARPMTAGTVGGVADAAPEAAAECGG